jgi:hypothetical protein
MLFYISLYVLAAVLLFQGVHALGELSAPMGVVPAEVRTNPARAGFWGGFLVVYGSVTILAGLVSHFNDWLVPALAPLRGLGLVVLALYGLWLVFGRKVDYTPAPVAAGAGHDHH